MLCGKTFRVTHVIGNTAQENPIWACINCCNSLGMIECADHHREPALIREIRAMNYAPVDKVIPASGNARHLALMPALV
jgi:hypothetical protein